MVSVLVKDGQQQLTLVTKGAPETVLDRCHDVPQAARDALATEFAAGNRVVAVATSAVTTEHAPQRATSTTCA
jgi:Mg2+-importing ATPase